MTQKEIENTVCNNHQKLENMKVAMSTVIQKQKNFTQWEKTQNGSLQRIESKLDKLIWWLMITFAGIVLSSIGFFIGNFFLVRKGF